MSNLTKNILLFLLTLPLIFVLGIIFEKNVGTASLFFRILGYWGFQYDWELSNSKFNLNRIYKLKSIAPAYQITELPIPNLDQRVEVELKSILHGRIMVLLAFGNSLAANNGITPFAPRNGVYNYFQGKFYRARDPLLNASGHGGSVWTRLADGLIEKNRVDNIILVSIAIENSSLLEWAPGGRLHDRFLGTIDGINQLGLQFTHIFWQPGHSDATKLKDLSAYSPLFQKMIRPLREKNGLAPIYIDLSTQCSIANATWQELTPLFQKLWQGQHGIYAGVNVDPFIASLQEKPCPLENASQQKHADLYMDILANNPTPFLNYP